MQTHTQALRAAEEHLTLVNKEQSYFREVCQSANDSIRETFMEAGSFTPPPPACRLDPCSSDMVAHYSFDMAQQVHYPSDPFQPGPMYFLTPRKCAIFGVCCEALPRQVNYLIDEASDTGKGANTISRLHHFQEHGLGETDVYLHGRQLRGAEQEQHHAPLPPLARHGWATPEHHPLFPRRRTHEVLPRLVLQSPQTAYPTQL